MTTPSRQDSWHAGPELLGAYAAGALDSVAQAAVETHVTRCSRCRDDARTLVRRGAPDADPLWEGIATRIAAPRRSSWSTLLRRMGLPEADLVVLRASTSLAVPFATALAAAICFALLSGQVAVDRQQAFYLLVAPLVPTLLVAGAYDATDPMREIGSTTPLSQVRIALLRTAVAVTAAVPILALMAAVPEVGLSPTAWLLPCLTLTVVALALLTWWDAARTVAAVAVAWVLAVAVLESAGSAELAATGAVQTVFAGVLLGAAAVWGSRLGILRKGATS